MPSWRHERVAEMIHRELAQHLRLTIKDPELEPISITRVEVTRDLGRATIWYLPLGGGAPSASLVAALGRAAGRLRGPIGRDLRLRTAPSLVFQTDELHEEVQRVHALLAEVGRELPSLEGLEE